MMEHIIDDRGKSTVDESVADEYDSGEHQNSTRFLFRTHVEELYDEHNTVTKVLTNLNDTLRTKLLPLIGKHEQRDNRRSQLIESVNKLQETIETLIVASDEIFLEKMKLVRKMEDTMLITAKSMDEQHDDDVVVVS